MHLRILSLIDYSFLRWPDFAVVPVLVALFVCSVSPMRAPAQTYDPIKKENLLRSLRLKEAPQTELIKNIKRHGVDFELSAEDAEMFRANGAGLSLIEAIRANYRGETGGNTKPEPPALPETKPAAIKNDEDAAAVFVPDGPPLSLDELLDMLNRRLSAPVVEKYVEKRGVNFYVTPEAATRIKAAGGANPLLGLMAFKTQTAGPDYEELIRAARFYVISANGERAADAIRSARQLAPDRPDAYFWQAQIHWQAKNVDAASRELIEAIKRGREHSFDDVSQEKKIVGTLIITKAGVSFKAGASPEFLSPTKAKNPGRDGKFQLEVAESGKTRTRTYYSRSYEEASLIVKLMERWIRKEAE